MLENIPTKKIHKQLFDATINGNKLQLQYAIKLVTTAKKKADDDNKLSSWLVSMAIIGAFEKIVNSETRRETEIAKSNEIEREIKENRSLGKWFYLASNHKDSAKDHAPYQGKLYYDMTAPTEIQRYASMHGLQTIQWVMGSPVWFITRPNCRHYFIPLTLNDVENKSDKKLVKQYKAYTKMGDSEFSTPYQSEINKYKAHLVELKSLYAIHRTERLERLIKKYTMVVYKHTSK